MASPYHRPVGSSLVGIRFLFGSVSPLLWLPSLPEFVDCLFGVGHVFFGDPLVIFRGPSLPFD